MPDFRERLRGPAEQRAPSERLKRELAQRRWNDMNDYADANGPSIEGVLAGG
jgi:GrpB-like predicted nucleotidyltransferase (UPF0157 family)